MKSASAIFEVISSPVRRRVLAYLSQTDLSADAIANRFELSKLAVSRHLNVLQNAGLITVRCAAQFHILPSQPRSFSNNTYDFLADFCPRSQISKKKQGGAL